MVKFFNENNNIKKSSKNDIDSLIEMVSKENMDIEEVIEKNKDEILNALPLKDHDDFDYPLFKDVLIQVIKKHLEKKAIRETKIQEDNEDYYDDFDDETTQKLNNLDYNVDTGVIYTEDDNSFSSNYQNFIDDGNEYRESLMNSSYIEFQESQSMDYCGYAFEDDYGYDDEYLDFQDPPEDYYLGSINTFEEVFIEYEEQKFIKENKNIDY